VDILQVPTTDSDDGDGGSATVTRKTIYSKTHVVNAMQRKCRLCFNSNEHSSVLQSQNVGCVSIVMNIPLYSSHKMQVVFQ